MLECMEILSIAAAARIRVHAIKGAWWLDETIQSKIISRAAEIERDLILARTTQALRARKAAGLPLGRTKGPGKSKFDPYRPEIEALLQSSPMAAENAPSRPLATRSDATGPKPRKPIPRAILHAHIAAAAWPSSSISDTNP